MNEVSLEELRDGALSAVDAVLREGPETIQAAALALTKSVVALRDGLIAALRSGDPGPKRELDHANALLSLVVSIQYPMQGQQSEKLSAAREQLRKLLEEIRAARS